MRKDRPEGLEDDHLTYLDALRENGEVNMFGAGEYLERDFDMGKKTARCVLKYWMSTFGRADR